MELVGTGLGDVIHHRAHIATVLGAVVGNHLEFSNSVLIAKED